ALGAGVAARLRRARLLGGLGGVLTVSAARLLAGILRRLLGGFLRRLLGGFLALLLARLLGRLLGGFLRRLLGGFLARLLRRLLTGLLRRRGGLGGGRRRGRGHVAAFAGLVGAGDLLGEVAHLLALERGRHDVAPDVGGERAAGDVPDAAEGGEDLLGAVVAGLEHAHGRDQLRGEADEPGGAEALRGAG